VEGEKKIEETGGKKKKQKKKKKRELCVCADKRGRERRS
jgi:hypothetical protein